MKYRVIKRYVSRAGPYYETYDSFEGAMNALLEKLAFYSEHEWLAQNLLSMELAQVPE